MEKTSENTSTNKLITIKKRVKARLTSISPEIVKKDYKMTPLPRIKENDTHRKSRTESDNALNFIKKELTSSISNLNTKQCFCASVSEISDEDYARISRLTERNKNHDCRPCHLSRDVSHTKDRPDRLNKLYDRDRSDLVQTLGLADVNIESLQLPTELDKLKEMLNHENKGNQAPNMIKASHSPLKNEIYNMNDFYHEKFIKDLDVIKRKSNKYLETKTISIAKEGGFLFKTQSGLIQPKHTQISDEKIPHKVSTRSKSIGNSEKTKINLDAKLNWKSERGAPSGRREVELLINWLDFMLDKYINNAEFATLELKSEAIQLIYTVCFKEIIRQVSVHCSERGNLLNRIWNSNFDLNTTNKNKFSGEIEEIKLRFKDLISKNQKDYEGKLSVVTKKYSEINGELRKCNKTINEQSIEIESLRNDLATERQRCKDINFANQTLLKQKDIAKREAKSNDENVRASTPYSQRTVATCTTEDEKILNPIDEEIVKFTVFRRETSFSLALADRVLKFKDIGCNTNEDELEDVMISKDTYKFLKDRAIMLDDIDYLTISPAYNLDQTVWMRVLASGLKKFTSNYIHTKGAETLSKSPNMSEEDADIQVIKCKSHQAEEVFIENINEITPEDVMMTPEIIKDEKSTQTEFELKKQFRHFIEMMEIDREKLKITADQLKNYTEKFQDTAKSTIFAKIILDLVQKTSKLIQREADMIEINQDFLRKQPPVICENQLNYKTDEIPKVFINELDITGVSMQDKLLLLDLLKKSKKIKDFLESQFSSQPKSDFSPETLKLKAKKLRFLLDKILNEPQSDNPLLTHNYAQIEAWDETLNFRGTLGDEEDKKSFHSDEDRFYLNTQQIKRKLTLISSRMTEKRLPSRKTHPSDKILVAFIQKLKKKTSNKASISIKMIMKLISSLYNERVLLMNEYPSIKKIPLSEMLYDEMLQKYGLKKVAQQKYKETINSASLYSESSIRIKNFLRFLGLNGHYKNDDLDFYLKTVDDINTGNSTQILVDDVALEVCVAYSRVILILKQIFEDKLPKQEWEILKSSIDLLKKPSESTKKSIFIGDLDVVNIDSVLEIMLSYYGRLKLQFFEFLMGINDSLSSDCSILFNSFIEIFEKLPVRLSEEETQNLFNLYSDLDYENPTNRHIHMDYILSIGVELSLVPFATLPQPTYI